MILLAAAGSGAGGHFSRLASNFAVLLEREGTEIVEFVGSVLLGAVAGGAAGFLGGVVAGLFLWLLLRRLGLFEAPWGWYRYARWAWAFAFILPLSLGGAYAGAWLSGGGRVLSAIRDRRLLDRIAARLLGALILDKADYEAKGKETAEEYERILADSKGISRLARADLERALAELQGESAGSPLARRAVPLLSREILDRLSASLEGFDPRALFLLLLDHPNLDEYARGHPEAGPGVAALAAQFDGLRAGAVRAVDGAVRGNALAGAGLGLGVPVVLLLLFRLLVHLVSPPAPPLPPAAAEPRGPGGV